MVEGFATNFLNKFISTAKSPESEDKDQTIKDLIEIAKGKIKYAIENIYQVPQKDSTIKLMEVDLYLIINNVDAKVREVAEKHSEQLNELKELINAGKKLLNMK